MFNRGFKISLFNIVPKGIHGGLVITSCFETSLFNIILKRLLYQKYANKSFENSLFNMIQKVENQKIYMFK